MALETPRASTAAYIRIGSQYDTIILGNGAGDSVDLAHAGYNDTITLGNGAGDTVNAYANLLYGIHSSTIILGNGVGDSRGCRVAAITTQSPSATGPATRCTSYRTNQISAARYDTITLGNGAGDSREPR